MPTPDVLAEIKCFGIADHPQFGSYLLYRHPGEFGPVRNNSVKEDFNLGSVGSRKRQSHLETAPDSPIEQFGMIGRGDHHDIARQLVELHEQEGDDALDLTGLMRVTAFLADRIELVEEKDGGLRPHIVEQTAEPGIGFAEITANQRVIANDKKRQGKRFGDPFGERCLAVTGRPGQQDAVPGLIPMSAQNVSADMFFHQLAPIFPHR